MSHLVCRTCGRKIYNLNAKNLFDAKDNALLKHIETLTGICFEADRYLPQHICGNCNSDLNHSIAFRQRCIKTNALMLEGKRRAQAAHKARKQKQLEMVEESPEPEPEPELEPIKIHKRASKKTTIVCKQETPFKTKRKLLSSYSPKTKEIVKQEIEEIVVNVAPTEDPELVISDESEKQVKHKVKHSGTNRNLVCDQCGKCFADASNLKVHILRHSGVKDFKCTECGENFFTRHLLHLHIRVRHLGEKPYACKYCDERFSTSTSRCRHERVKHTRTLSFTCRICDKSFITQTCLKKHEFLHTGERPYGCDICNVAFPRNTNLKIHYRSKQHQKRAAEVAEHPLENSEEDDIDYSESVIDELDV